MTATQRSCALPVPDPTISYWQAKAQGSPILDHGQTDPLPDSNTIADVAIIGSGISGAVAAYTLQQQAPHLSVIMLEARQTCSGATGRNGGHLRPDQFLGFDRYSEIVGKEQAHKVLLSEWDTFTLIKGIIAKEKIDCDWWEGLTMTVYLHEAVMQIAKSSFESYKAYTALRPDVRFVENEDEARKLSRIPESIGAAVFPAASLYPLRFVHALLSLCLDRGSFQLFTHTPVHSLSRQGSHWNLQTDRGTVSARKVLMATNAYSRALLPSLDNFLLSHRAHCSSIIPPPTYQGSHSLQSTCSITQAKGDYEYLVQRPNDNAFILGGGHTVITKEREIDTYDDSYLDPALPPYFSSYPARIFADWNKSEGELTHTWTGIQGYTRDSLPIVGESFEEEGLYLCLGFNGHGMAFAGAASSGVVQLMLSDKKEMTDEEWETLTGLPLCYRWTKNRSNRADVDCRMNF